MYQYQTNTVNVVRNMHLDKNTLERVLVEPGHINKKVLEKVCEDAKSTQTQPEKVLVSKGYISATNLSKSVAHYLNYRFIELTEADIDEAILEYIPEVVAHAQRAIVFKVTSDAIHLATTNVHIYEFIKFLEKKTHKKVEPYFTTDRSLNNVLSLYRGNLRESIVALIASIEINADEGDIVTLVNQILEYATYSRASDIHLEPLDDVVLIRFRIDGVLHEVTSYPKAMHDNVVFRVKIMARLQTDEQLAAQDGRFDYALREENIDIRVSILPVTGGENIVLRLLAGRTESYTLKDLGLTEKDRNKVVSAVSKPNGMLLVVGPTGSGKTTLLYALLALRNQPKVNIMTIEDPVEYDIERVQQTQVNQKKNLTFATGLRSLVRQDPDIIMVGEIRDNETADIAVNAAMTGHLLFSTMHTNDAATTFPRLTEMSVEPFLVASSVNVVVALRLVRKICESCRVSKKLDRKTRSIINKNEVIKHAFEHVTGTEKINNIQLYIGKGCKACGDTGYYGRMCIFEVLEVTDQIRNLILQKRSAEEIKRTAITLGMTPMLEDGLRKVIEGVTTFDEVLRISKV